jgi:hypothetical protein
VATTAGSRSGVSADGGPSEIDLLDAATDRKNVSQTIRLDRKTAKRPHMSVCLDAGIGGVLLRPPQA